MTWLPQSSVQPTTSPGRSSDRLEEGGQMAAHDVHDEELIHWSLSLSPQQRLSVLQDFIDTFWRPIHG